MTEALVEVSLVARQNVFTAKAEDNEKNEASDTADATVTFTDVKPAIEVTKVANPTSVLEPGGDVTYTFTVKNTSPAKEPVTITSLSMTRSGRCLGMLTASRHGPEHPGCLAARFPGDRGAESVSLGDSHKKTCSRPRLTDDEKNEASDTADATVTFTDVKPAIEVTKVANPTSVLEPGGDVDLHVHGEEHLAGEGAGDDHELVR